MKTFIIISLLVAAVYGGNLIPAGTPITQCDAQDLECPEISNTEVGEGFELRSYPTSKWVSSLCIGVGLDDFERCSGEGFNKLFEYISGANSENMKIDMTGPVINSIIPGSGPNCESNFTTSFYVPSALWDNTPAPTASDVFLEDFPEQNRYIIAFDGFADVNDYMDFARQLVDRVGDSSLYNGDYYYFAGYNSPFDITERRNEVWFIAK